MKKIATFILFAFTLFGAQAVEEEIVKSEINNVTVYSQGAQIYRKANYSVKSGITKIVIEGISQTIDPNSLQVKASGNVIILDSKYSLFYPKPDETPIDGLPLKVRQDIQKLEDSLNNLGYELMVIQDEIDVLNSTKSILANNGAIRGQGKVNDSIGLLKEAIDYYAVKMMEINKRLHVLNRSKNDKNVVKSGMQNRLQKLRNYQNSNNLNPRPTGPIPRITVTVQASAATVGKLDVSYLVSQAGWSPLYDLRSEITNGQVNLNYKAQVYQNTGVDWNDVRLSISTNNPYHNKTKPTLHPWYIDYYAYNTRPNYQQNVVNNMYTGRAEKAAQPASTQAYSDSEDASLGGNIQAKFADQFVTVVDHMISAEFKIDLPYTIESNNEQHMVLIKNVDLKANYKYFTVPKLDKSVYLVAQISKLDELQLVPAKANIFFDGTYIGETYLDPTSLDDTLNLSLGKDPNIIVKRTLLKQECKDKVVGNDHERIFSYQLEVKNLKSTNIEVIVQDQVPITQNGEIEIEMLNDGKADYNSVTGLMEWELKLKPRQNEIIKFSYKVKHPKDKNVPL